MLDDPALLILCALGIAVFFVAVYLIASAPREMTTSNRHRQ